MARRVVDGSGWEAMLTDQVRRTGQRLYRLAYRVLRQPAAAEDICQQAFLKAWEVRDSIRDPELLEGWLVRVVMNLSLAALRRQKLELRPPDALRHPFPTGEAFVPGDGAISLAEQSEFREAARAVLQELPEATQMVVVLRVMEGLPGQEVKRLLGCSASEVSRRLHHGLEYLRRRLADSYAPPCR